MTPEACRLPANPALGVAGKRPANLAAGHTEIHASAGIIQNFGAKG